MDESKYRHQLVGPPRLWEMKRRFQHRFLVAEGLVPRHTLLDLGCGTLRGGVPLIDYLDPGHYFGVDVRAEALEEGRRELADHGLAGKHPVLIESADLSQLTLDRKFDVVWAFSVLIHMPDRVLGDALGFVARHLAPTGVMYANANIGEREAGKWRAFPVMWRPLGFYRDTAAKAGLSLDDIGALGDLGHCSNVPAQDAQRMLRLMHQ